MVLNCHVCVGNWTQVLWKSIQCILKNFVYYLCLWHHAPDSICLPPPQIKFKRKKERKKGKISSWKFLCDTVSHAVNPLSIHFLLQEFITKSQWSGSRPLVSAIPSMLGPHWDFSWSSSCCPVSGDSAALGSQDWPFLPPALADHMWSGYWGGQTHNPGSGPG